MIKISFIVPVYNRESYLPLCIESLINQTLKEIEILLIDNGSTDNSPQICRQYASNDVRIRYFRLEQSGVGPARNFGLHHAKGRYIGFVDSDDYLDFDFARLMYYQAVASNSIFNCCGIIKFHEVLLRKNYFYPPDHIEENSFFKNHEIANPVWNKIFRKDIIDRYELRFSNSINYVEDYAFVVLFYLLGSQEGNISVCSQLLYHYRQHDHSTMAKIFAQLPSRIVDLEKNVIEIITKLKYHGISHKTCPLIKSIIFDYYLIELPLWLIKIALDEKSITTKQARIILESYRMLVAKYQSGFTISGKIIKLLALTEIHFQLFLNYAKHQN